MGNYAKDWNKLWNKSLNQRINETSITKKYIRELLSGFITNKTIFLDLGCGSGFYSQTFVGLAKKVYSLDFSKNALNLTTKKCNNKNIPIQFDLLSSKKLGFTDKIDVCFSDGLLEHFKYEDSKKILQKVKKVISKEGYVISLVPHKYHFYTLFRNFFLSKDIYEKPMTKKELHNLHSSVFRETKIIGLTFLPFIIDIKFLAKFFPMHIIAISKV